MACDDRQGGEKMSPVHVRAEPGEFAESVLLPGDPLRAKYIAENFFEDAKLVTGERGMLGYTGTYGGKEVSVQATGMGCPSAAIVTEELIQLGAKNLGRAGGQLRPVLRSYRRPGDVMGRPRGSRRRDGGRGDLYRSSDGRC